METMKLRRDFDLPEEDEENLDARGLPWEAVNEGAFHWLLIHDFPVPHGYNVRAVTVAIQIPTNYPVAGLDMAYFSPALLREDGVPIPATDATITIQNRPFQRWSRHRTSENPWRPGIDNVATHLALVEEWLQQEFRKRPKGQPA